DRRPDERVVALGYDDVDRVRIQGKRRAGDGERGVGHATRPGLDDGLRRARPARLLEDEDAVERVELEQPHLDELLPEAGHPAGVVLPRRPHGVGRALLLQQVARRDPEGELVVGEGEPHRGNPRTRSATTLRWISLV